VSHRYFMNDPQDFVREAVEGFCVANSSLSFKHDPLYVFDGSKEPDRVAIVSGGGTGHEPLHVGFVGAGMLDAAVPGAVFSSPTALQIAEATERVAGSAGVLHIVKNYTGDVLNFSIAAEICEDKGIQVQRVVVDDDVATDIEGSRVGRRGTAATLLVEKVCGAAAQEGKSLSEVAEIGRRAAAETRSMALAFDACTHPETGDKSFELNDDEVEFGVGIHGERGRARIPFGTADEVAKSLLDPICDSLNFEPGDDVIVVINGLGSTHLTEQYVITRAVNNLLASRGLNPLRWLTGSYVTALNMSGVSVTLSRADEERINLWDAPVKTPALCW
jgi:dihydroxyacetone kinase-like protein